MCHEISDLQFFSWFEPIWAPDKQAKVFSESHSAVWCTPRSWTQRCDAHHGVWLRCEKHTTESDSAVWCTPRRFFLNFDHLTLRCDAHRGAWLCGGMHTGLGTEECCVRYATFFCVLLKNTAFFFGFFWNFRRLMKPKRTLQYFAFFLKERAFFKKNACSFQKKAHSFKRTRVLFQP